MEFCGRMSYPALHQKGRIDLDDAAFYDDERVVTTSVWRMRWSCKIRCPFAASYNRRRIDLYDGVNCDS